jgi:hypothetical protein
MKCKLCQNEIDEKGKYVHVEDWFNKKIIKEIYCHIVCFNKAMNRDLTELEKMAKEMITKAQPLLNQIGSSIPKEYEIK